MRARGEVGAGKEPIFIRYLKRLAETKTKEKRFGFVELENGNDAHTSRSNRHGFIRGGLAVPLLELRGGDERSAQVTVTHSLGLPPGGVLLTDNLENVPPLKRKSRLLARRGFILIRCVVEQSSQVNLQKRQ